MLSNRDRLIQFYRIHNPSKIHEVDHILQEFQGREQELFNVLAQKYPNPPPNTAQPSPSLPPPPYPHQPQSAIPPSTTQSSRNDAVKRFADLLENTESRRTAREAKDVLQAAESAISDTLRHVLETLKIERAEIESSRRDLDRERQELYQALEAARSELQQREIKVVQQENQLANLALSLKQAQESGVAKLQADLDRFFQSNNDLLAAPRPIVGLTPSSPSSRTPRRFQQQISDISVNSGAAYHHNVIGHGLDGSQSQPPSSRNRPRDPITTALRTAKANDVVCLQPGVYVDNVILEKSVEIRGMGTRRDDVVIEASDSTLPCFEIHQGSIVLSNLTIRQKSGSEASCLSVVGKSDVKLRNVLITDGNGGVVTGEEATATLIDSTVQQCGFAGLFGRDTSYVVAENTTFSDCEVSVRVRDGTFLVKRCNIVDSGSDGIVLHGGAKGIVEGTTVEHSKGNGIVLSGRSETLLSRNSIVQNGKWGVWFPAQAQCTLTDNEIINNVQGNVTNVL